MMQIPLTSPELTRFLHLQELNRRRQTGSFPSSIESGGRLEMPSRSRFRSGTSCSEASTGTPSSSPSPPPPSTIGENFTANNLAGHQNSAKPTAKSFTIDAILGIRSDRSEVEEIGRDHQLKMIPNNFHPRFGFHLSGSPLANGFSNSALEMAARKMEGTKFANSSADFLAGFQRIPTDFTNSSDVSDFACEISRSRNFQDQISAFNQNSNSLGESTDKSSKDISKKCGGKSKRVRTIFTPEQLERLEAEFERQQYMVGPERLYLAHTLQLTEAQVKVWFQNRRIKWRKQNLEIQQQRLAAMKQRNQRREAEDSEEESRDSNNYPFAAEINEIPTSGGFLKSGIDSNELESDSGQFRIDLETSNTIENLKTENSSIKV